jgi:menaquinone-dependent protoporphyrinogen oxidase
MEDRILVAYVSKYGATSEIAEKIGQVLRHSGLQADVSSADHVDNLALYHDVVFGSAVYFGHWRKKAVAFLNSREKLLAAMPVWLFFSGPTGKVDPRVQAMRGQSIPEGQRPIIDRIKPRDIAFFLGKIDAVRLNFLERWAIKKVNAPLGDFRDWDAITSWAETIVDTRTKGRMK